MNQAGANPEGAFGFVLAGGESRRMGQDKPLLRFAGRPLVVNALEILRDAGLEARIAGARPDLEQFAPVVPDAQPGRGPLGGICAALAACNARRVLFLPVDLPLLPASLVTLMVHRAEVTGAVVTLASVSGFGQTFPAVIDREALPALQSGLAHGRGGCFEAFQAAAAHSGQRLEAFAVEYVAQAGQAEHPHGLPAAFWYLNVNSPADLRRAEALCRRAVA